MTKIGKVTALTSNQSLLTTQQYHLIYCCVGESTINAVFLEKTLLLFIVTIDDITMALREAKVSYSKLRRRRAVKIGNVAHAAAPYG